jgi:CheY-like chemotaxis protein
MALRVLVVDDSKDSTDAMEMLLAAWGFEGRAALDGPSALQIAESFRPDAVILDIAMPGMDGYEVARRLRQTFGEKLTIICVSGLGTEEHRRQSREAGCNHHLLKPADPEELERLLKSVQGPRI